MYSCLSWNQGDCLLCRHTHQQLTSTQGHDQGCTQRGVLRSGHRAPSAASACLHPARRRQVPPTLPAESSRRSAGLHAPWHGDSACVPLLRSEVRVASAVYTQGGASAWGWQSRGAADLGLAVQRACLACRAAPQLAEACRVLGLEAPVQDAVEVRQAYLRRSGPSGGALAPTQVAAGWPVADACIMYTRAAGGARPANWLEALHAISSGCQCL